MVDITYIILNRYILIHPHMTPHLNTFRLYMIKGYTLVVCFVHICSAKYINRAFTFRWLIWLVEQVMRFFFTLFSSSENQTRQLPCCLVCLNGSYGPGKQFQRLLLICLSLVVRNLLEEWFVLFFGYFIASNFKIFWFWWRKKKIWFRVFVI
jgi:hypothetical protein